MKLSSSVDSSDRRLKKATKFQTREPIPSNPISTKNSGRRVTNCSILWRKFYRLFHWTIATRISRTPCFKRINLNNSYYQNGYRYWRHWTLIYDDSAPTYNEVAKAINRSKTGASPSPIDQLSCIMLKRCPILRTLLGKIIAECWNKCTVPDCWKRGSTILIYKKEWPG